MPDYGLLGALSGTDNWQAKENARRADLTYKAASNAIQQQHIDENHKVQQTMGAYYNAINNLKVLPKGLQRIQEVSDTLKPQIAQSIKESGGDLNKWFETRGNVDLDNYLSTVMTHPTTQRELANATHVAHYQADQQAGLQERMNFDDKGQPVNPFTDQLKKYENGDTDVINYAGGYKPGKFDEKFFGQTYGSTNRYQPKTVSLEDYAATAQRQLEAQGMNQQDAKQQAMGMSYAYKQHLANKGTPLQWKSDKYTANEALAAFKLQKLKAMGGASAGLSYLAGIHDDLSGFTADWASNDRKDRIYNPGVTDLHHLVHAVGNEINEKTGGVKSISAMAARGGTYSTDFQPLNFEGITDKDMTAVPIGARHKDGIDYIKYRVKANDEALKQMKEAGKDVEGGIFSSNQPISGAKVKSYGGFLGVGKNHEMEFDMYQAVPFNSSTVAQQEVKQNEYSKTGQEALGTGVVYSKMQQMATDALQGTPAEDESEPAE